MRSVFPPPPASQSTAEINALLASRGSDFRVRSQVPGAVAKVVG